MDKGFSHLLFIIIICIIYFLFLSCFVKDRISKEKLLYRSWSMIHRVEYNRTSRNYNRYRTRKSIIDYDTNIPDSIKVENQSRLRVTTGETCWIHEFRHVSPIDVLRFVSHTSTRLLSAYGDKFKNNFFPKTFDHLPILNYRRSFELMWENFRNY